MQSRLSRVKCYTDGELLCERKAVIYGLAVRLSHPAAKIEDNSTSVLVAKIDGGVF